MNIRIDAELVFELLRTVCLAAKTFSNDGVHVDFVLNQIKEPKNFRPLKTLSDGHDREMRYDPRDGEWHQRDLKKAPPRICYKIRRQGDSGWSPKTAIGQPKETKFSKKTAVTLLPPDGRTDLYQPKHGKVAGLLFNTNACNLKSEKYIFPKMANTDERWWLHHKGKKRLAQKSMTLEQLQARLHLSTQQSLILPPNELLIGLSLESLVGVFTPIDSRESRIEALLLQQKIAQELKIILPIFIINQHGMRIYSTRQKQEDLRESQILADPKILNPLPGINPSELKGLNDFYFKLENLGKKDNLSLCQIASFLSLFELSKLGQTNKFFRLKFNNQNHLWRHAALRKVPLPPEINNKHDLLLHLGTSRQPNVALVEFARQHPDNAYQIMQSPHFSNQLPLKERQLTSSNSSIFKPLHGFLGGFLGFTIGLVLTLYFVLQALLRVLISLVSLSFAAPVFKTSFARSFLGSTFFPLYSLCMSVGIGAFYGWNYGLKNLRHLKEGLHMFHHELYHGNKRNSGAVDPWTMCYYWSHDDTIYGGQRTHLPTFFKTKRATVADIASAVHQKKPLSLMCKEPEVLLPVQPDEKQPLLKNAVVL